MSVPYTTEALKTLTVDDCSSTPGTLSTAGFLLIVAAVSSVYASNGDGVVDAAAFLLAISGVAAFIGGR